MIKDEKNMIPERLRNKKTFTRKEYGQAMNQEYGLNEQQSKYSLQKLISDGEIVHMGWNQYTVGGKRLIYSHEYSDSAKKIAKKIEEKYDDINFQVFELTQLNLFMNHLIAHNTIIIGVENDLIDFVFDTLNREYPGRVLLKPSLDMYYRYHQDNEIVIERLPSETPKGLDKPWQSRIEKILVDILVDKLISRIVPDGEKAAIVEGAYQEFLVDEGTMLRYAKRKGAVQKMEKALREYGRELKA